MVQRRATPEKQARARALRRDPPTAEYALWQLLRRRQVAGLRFRRRAIVLGWIPDFWCPAIKLAIEIDANMNQAKARRDQARDPHLARHGIRTLHVCAKDVQNAPGKVVEQIIAAAGDVRQERLA